MAKCNCKWTLPTGLQRRVDEEEEEPNGKCDHCGMSESVQHVMLEGREYEEEMSLSLHTPVQ